MAPLRCPHSRRCPGCPLIELPYAAQLALKHASLARALGRYPYLGTVTPAPTVPAAPVEGFRLRSKLVTDGRALGLFARASHQVVDIPGCLIQRPRVLAVAGALRRSLPALRDVSSFDLREADDGVLVTAAVRPSLTPAARQALAERIAALEPSVAGVAVSTREPDAPQVLGSVPETLVGPGELRHRPDPEAPFHYAAHGAFTQAHAGQLARLHAAIELALANGASSRRSSQAPRVLELYAGSGALSLRLAAHGYAVTLVEAFAPAVRMADRAATEQRLPLTALVADTAAALADFARQGARFDSVIVNPPRRGVAPEVRRLLGKLAPARIVYISCNPETLARDAAHLTATGHALTTATPFDMIPQSDAVETLAVFEPAPPPPPRVLAEGDFFLIVDKEPHVPVTLTDGDPSALEARVRRLPGAELAAAVDLLDREASGACVFARRATDVTALRRALAEGSAECTALVRGVIRARSTLPNQGTLGASSRYERVDTGPGHSLVRVATAPAAFDDALRAFASFRHPVLGDGRFGDRRANVHFAMRHDLDRTFWHRTRLELELPGTRIRVESSLAPDLEAVLASARSTKAE